MTTLTPVRPASFIARGVDVASRGVVSGDSATRRALDAISAQPGRVAFTGAAASVPPVVAMHLAAPASIEPVTWTISDYVVSVPGGVPLFGMTVVALSLGAAAIAQGLTALSDTRLVRWLLATWAIALLVALAFPTNMRGTPENLSSNVHLVAGGVAFAVLPIAGALMARRYRAAFGRSWSTVSLAVASAVTGVLSAALILNRLPGVFGFPEIMLPPGILQRAAGAMQIALVAVAALVIVFAGRRAVRGSRVG